MFTRWSIDDGFLHGNEVVEGEVGRAHCDLLRFRVDVGRLKDLGGILATHHRKEPFWCRLLTGNESFGSQLIGRLVNTI